MAHKLTAAQKSELRELIEALDNARSALRDRASEMADELREALDERSEKWQEGEAGQAAIELIDNLQVMADECDGYEPSIGFLED